MALKAWPLEDVPMDGKEEQKRIIKEALKEWLDEKFIMFGKWSAAGFAAATLFALTYFIFWMEGRLKLP